MVATRETPTSARGEHNSSTLQATSMASTASSVFGGGKTSTNSALPVPLKRKITDQNLETITIDPMYDLTLIIGTPEHIKGQKAFQVNKGSFRNISAVWTKMLNGNWAESSQSEICLPEDNCEAFHIVLQIAHFQLSKLPENLSREKLIDLAILADKYELATVVRVGLDLKNWMEPHKKAYTSQPDAALQDFAIITSAFNLQSDFTYLASRLATELEVDNHGKFYHLDVHKKRIPLRPYMPSSVSEKIERVRYDILSAWIACCTAGLNNCNPPPCNETICAATKAGALLNGLKSAGFFPSPSSAAVMYGNVIRYWRFLRSIGSTYQTYSPCYYSGITIRSSSHHRRGDCNFAKCFGDFGIIAAARAILERHIHKDLWKQWQEEKIV